MDLKQTFAELTTKYTSDSRLIDKLWKEISVMYGDKSRHYHTLSHLDNLLLLLEEVRNEIKDWEAVVFAVFYHDIVYKSTSDKNEEKSADLAKLRLAELSFPAHRLLKCCSMILATKSHTSADDSDTNYFTDADLSVLGQDWDTYSLYAKQVRQEYSIYPDLLYNPGRRKVINHFLKMSRIFKTQYFFDKFENRAKKNLNRELKTL